jgi:nucleotide-binding universal stress UspA family protein
MVDTLRSPAFRLRLTVLEYKSRVEKIVAGVDGSDTSKDALRWALEETRLRQARLQVVHAWEPPPPFPDVAPAPSPAFEVVELLPALQRSAEDLVKRVVEEVAGDDPGIQVETLAVEGPAASVLVDAARDAQLLVVGSRGHGRFASLLLGSVSQALAHHAPCPLVIHRKSQ